MNHLLVALAGSPNSGKTTLFNLLTGSRQKTGNYPGVTVEKKEGFIKDWNATILDLPGLYSLSPKSPDEEVSAAIILGSTQLSKRPEVLIAVADVTNLERQLYLVTELREINIPVVLALTMSDLLHSRGLKIDRKKLETRLGIPVVELSSVENSGIEQLKAAVLKASESTATPKQRLPQSQEFIEARFRFIEELVRECVSQSTVYDQITNRIDKIVLHKFFGPIILITLFTLMFQLIFSLAEIPMNLIEGAFGQLTQFVQQSLPESTFRDLLADGIIAGVGSVVVFLPQILILFSFIILFEDSGYMARAAFILDRLMSKVGLNGRAFIPLLSSFACAVPGIMATRTIESKKERLLTILIAPLMACSARIPVYSMLVGAFVPNHKIFGLINLQGIVLFGLYFFAIVIAMIVAYVFGKLLFKKTETTPFLIELPTYKKPSLRNLALGLYDRAFVFLKKAGTTILALSIALWFLANYPKVEAPQNLQNESANSYKLEHSYMGQAGKIIAPAVKPLGYDWKIGIGLLSSFAAREVVIATLSTIYSVEDGSENGDALVTKLKNATNPDGSKAFSLATALSMLVFFMLACQCMSTLAVVKRETNSLKWPVFLFSYMTILAYGLAYMTYHLANHYWPNL